MDPQEPFPASLDLVVDHPPSPVKREKSHRCETFGLDEDIGSDDWVFEDVLPQEPEEPSPAAEISSGFKVSFAATLSEKNVQDFGRAARAKYCAAAAEALGVSEGQVAVESVAAGSVIIATTVSGLSSEAASAVASKAVDPGALAKGLASVGFGACTVFHVAIEDAHAEEEKVWASHQSTEPFSPLSPGMPTLFARFAGSDTDAIDETYLARPGATRQLKIGDEVEGRLKGKFDWLPAEVTAMNAATGTLDLRYQQGDAEAAVPFLRVRFPGQVEPEVLQPGQRVEAMAEDWDVSRPASVMVGLPDGFTYVLHFENGEGQLFVPRDCIFAQCLAVEARSEDMLEFEQDLSAAAITPRQLSSQPALPVGSVAEASPEAAEKPTLAHSEDTEEVIRDYLNVKFVQLTEAPDVIDDVLTKKIVRDYLDEQFAQPADEPLDTEKPGAGQKPRKVKMSSAQGQERKTVERNGVQSAASARGRRQSELNVQTKKNQPVRRNTVGVKSKGSPSAGFQSRFEAEAHILSPGPRLLAPGPGNGIPSCLFQLTLARQQFSFI